MKKSLLSRGLLLIVAGALGACAYPRIGFRLMAPLAILLALPTFVPLATDLRSMALGRGAPHA